MASAGFRVIMRSSRKLRASLTPSPASKPHTKGYPSLTPFPPSNNQKRKLTTKRKIIKSQSDNGLSSAFRNLSLTPNPQPTNYSRSSSPRKPKSGKSRSLSTVSVSTIVDIINLIKDEKCKNIIVMAGAGISTPSGIPDFRTPGTGLYDNLQEYNIPEPTAIFDIEYFWYDPRPFFCLAKTLYPGNFQPNYVHYFINLLNNKGLLLKMYTQNIDGLERLAGLPKDKLVEAHGTFSSASCIKCCKKYDGDTIKKVILKGDIPRCIAPKCKGIIKPDIVFFGEDLPKKFYSYEKDFPKCDLLIVMGTSLEVQPFAGIVSEVSCSTPRLLINREVVGPFASPWRGRGNDVVLKGDVITGIKQLVKLLDWTDVMNNIVEKENKIWENKEENNLESKNPDSSTPRLTQPTPIKTNGTLDNTRKFHSLAGNPENDGISKNEDTSNTLFAQNSVSDSMTKRTLLPERIFRTNDRTNDSATINDTKTMRLLSGNGTRFNLPGKDKDFNQSSTDVNGKNSSQTGYHPEKNSLFSCNSVARRMPLLPFRYTHRNVPESSTGDYNYKCIDPSKDLASAGFGMGTRRKFDLSSSLCSEASSSCSNDDSSGE